jgi:hypothetical protein
MVVYGLGNGTPASAFGEMNGGDKAFQTSSALGFFQDARAAALALPGILRAMDAMNDKATESEGSQAIKDAELSNYRLNSSSSGWLNQNVDLPGGWKTQRRELLKLVPLAGGMACLWVAFTRAKVTNVLDKCDLPLHTTAGSIIAFLGLLQ